MNLARILVLAAASLAIGNAAAAQTDRARIGGMDIDQELIELPWRLAESPDGAFISRINAYRGVPVLRRGIRVVIEGGGFQVRRDGAGSSAGSMAYLSVPVPGAARTEAWPLAIRSWSDTRIVADVPLDGPYTTYDGRVTLVVQGVHPDGFLTTLRVERVRFIPG